MKRFHEILLIAAVLFLQAPTASAQCLVRDSLIKIYPYFEKNDTLIYTQEKLEMTIVGQDTTITKNIKDLYQITCRKANDKKGYLLEETHLLTEDLTEPQGNPDENQKLKQALLETMMESLRDIKVEFQIDAMGENLKVVNPDKVVAEIKHRIDEAYSIFTNQYPLMGSLFSKEAFMGMFKNMLETPEQLLNTFDEMVTMFELHGAVYDYEVVKTIPMEGPGYTRPGEMRCIAIDVPYKDSPKQDFDEYKFVIESETYQDAATATATRVSQSLGREVSIEQVKQILGDKMPSGELVVQETLENQYFFDGWPKEFYHCIESTSNVGTTIEITYIVCQERNWKR